MKMRFFWALFLAGAALRAGEVRLQAYGEIPAAARDAFGDTIGGLGSAACYDPRTDSVFLMPDRGASDGGIDYRPRCYRVKFTPSATRPGRLDYRLEQTILFRDENGRPFSGLLADTAVAPTQAGRRCLDPEAIAVTPDGSLYVSDEYAPALLHFDRAGRLLRELPLPAWYRPVDSRNRPSYLTRSALAAGREENRGAEAMGILPGGRRAVLILQSALVQDGGKSAGTSRILLLDLRTGRPVAEYAYAFSRPAGAAFRHLSVNDLAVVDDHTFLILERDNLGRDGPLASTTARDKAVWIVDVRGATNLVRDRGKPIRRDSKIRFARKKLLFNLPDLLPQLGLSPTQLAAKWEGLALLPPRSKRAFHLLMTADNDFLNPTLHFDGRTLRFPRARDAVPTQVFEILAPAP